MSRCRIAREIVVLLIRQHDKFRMAPYFTQSVVVRSDIRDLKGLQGKKIGITRFGSVTDFAIRTLLERHNLKDVNILQMGGFPEAVAGLARGAIDGAVLSPPHNFRMIKEGFRELAGPKDLRALGSGFLTQGIVARKSFGATHRDIVVRIIKSTVEGHEICHEQRRFYQAHDQQISWDYRSGSSAPELSVHRRDFCARAFRAGKYDAIDGTTHGSGQYDRRKIRSNDTDQRLLRQ